MREFFDGFERPWWVVGGWAIEAFTGAPRGHEDVDVSILVCDIPALREHVGERWQLWNIATAPSGRSPTTGLTSAPGEPDLGPA